MALTLRWQDITQSFWAFSAAIICLVVFAVGVGAAVYYFRQVFREMRKARVAMVRMTRELKRETRS